MTAPGFFAGAAGPIIGGGLSALGGLFGGNAQANAQKAGVKEQQRQFDLGGWTGAAHSLETSGLRDKLLAMFGQIASQGPQNFTPRDAFNPTGTNAMGQPTAGPSAGQGGMGQGQLNLPSTYKMGDGGVNPDVYSWLLRNLGYRPTDDPARLAAAAKLEQEKAAYAQSQQPRAPTSPGSGQFALQPGQRGFGGY